MPKGRPKVPGRKVPPLTTRVLPPDYARLEEIAKAKGVSKTDLVREAVIQYLDRQEAQTEIEIKDRIVAKLEEMEKRLLAEQKRSTERLAKIGSRGLIDIATINQVLFLRSDKNTRRDLWKQSRQAALERLGVGKRQGDPDAAEVANAFGGEA